MRAAAVTYAAATIRLINTLLSRLHSIGVKFHLTVRRADTTEKRTQQICLREIRSLTLPE